MKTAIKAESLSEWDSRLNGSSLMGIATGSYHELVDLFGEPVVETDGYKTDAEWIIQLGSMLLTIYNYKDGKNYLGADGLNVSQITDWHIGAKSQQAVWALDEYFEQEGARISARVR
jgi:hypothetical protein